MKALKQNGREGKITARIAFLLAFAILLLVCGIPKVQAEVVKIGLTGQVRSVSDPCSLLENKVHQNDSITGFYIYDSLSTDLFPNNASYGEYRFYTSPFGISLTISDLTFQTDQTNVNVLIGIANDYESAPSDSYWINSYNNLDLGSEIQIERILFQLDDYSGMAISSDVLQTTPPNLPVWQFDYLLISGGRGGTPPCYDEPFQISGDVTSVYIIPEPATILLIGLGGLFIRKRN